MPEELPITPEQRATTPSPATNARSLRLSKTRVGLAFAIAVISDALGAFVTLAPPIVWAADLLTAILLFIVLGWHWLLLPGLILEAIPAVGVMPLWMAVVAAVAVWGTPRPRIK